MGATRAAWSGRDDTATGTATGTAGFTVPACAAMPKDRPPAWQPRSGQPRQAGVRLMCPFPPERRCLVPTTTPPVPPHQKEAERATRAGRMRGGVSPPAAILSGPSDDPEGTVVR